jgi:ribose/xylose/arabinose/galactoside ABC-type transport system permease subunit
MTAKYAKHKVGNIEGIVLVGGIVGCALLFSVFESRFFSLENLRVILETMSVLAILSLGLSLLLIGGEIDVSFTSVLEFSAAIVAILSGWRFPTFVAIIVALFGAIIVGVMNGFFTVRLRIPSFLVTLASQVIVGGVVLIMCDYRAVLISDQTFLNLFYGRPIGKVAACVYWMFAIALFLWFFLAKTKTGRWTFATGGNEEAARLMGVPTGRVKLLLFVLNGCLAGVAGFILGSRAMSARPLMSTGYLMPAIAAPIMAGASLTGGRGSIPKTMLAVFLLSIVTNGVSLLGLEPAYRDILMGAVLVVALSIRQLQVLAGQG